MLVYKHETEMGRVLSVYLSEDSPPLVTIVCDAPGERAVSHPLTLEQWDAAVVRIDSVLAERSA